MLLESLLGLYELLILTSLQKSELSPKDTSLDALRAVVGDRLHATTPFSTPCFVNPDGEECLSVKADYVDEGGPMTENACTLMIINGPTKLRVLVTLELMFKRSGKLAREHMNSV